MILLRKIPVFGLAVLVISAILAPLLFAYGNPASTDVFLQQRQGRRRQAAIPEDVKLERDVVYGKGSERDLKLDIVRPKEKPGKPMPVLVWIHGGGWRGGNKTSGIRRIIPYARRGYFCATIEYRLSAEATFPAQIEDCKCAIRFLRSKAEEYNLDPDRIGVWGSSAGGHLVALLGTSGGLKELEGQGGHEKYSSSVQAVCDWFGPSDLTKIVEEGRHAQPGNPVELMLGGPVRDNLEKAKMASPVTHIDKDDPPFLIIHGDKDSTVPVSQSKLLHEKLKAADVDSTLKILKDMGHGGVLFEDPLVQALIADFFDRHLKTNSEGPETGGEQSAPEKSEEKPTKQPQGDGTKKSGG